MKLFYNTEEVAEMLQISNSKLNYYLKVFKISIDKVGRIKKFTHNDIEKVEQIVMLIEKEGYTLEGVKEKLKEKREVKQYNKEVIEKLKDIKSSLQILHDLL